MLLIKKGTSTAVVQSSDVAIGQYNVTWNSQEISAYRDSAGLLHRDTIASKPPKVEFYTRNMMTGAELHTFLSRIQAQYSDAKQRKISNAKVFVPEYNDYVQDDIYLADFTPVIDHIDESTSPATVYYKSFRMAFIGYGTSNSYQDV